MHPVVDELAKLPVSEQLEIVQQLWDSIASSRGELVPQPGRREVLQERLAQLEGRETEIGLSREEVWAQVDSRRGS